MNINAIFYKEKKIEFWEERIFHNPLCEIWKFIIFIKYLSTHNYKKRSTRHTQYIKDEWRDVYTQNITLLIYAMTTIDWYTTATKTYQPPPALIKRKKVVTCYWEVNICYSNHNSTHLVPRVYNLINFLTNTHLVLLSEPVVVLLYKKVFNIFLWQKVANRTTVQIFV